MVNNFEIKKAGKSDSATIRDLARAIWPSTFKKILTENQIHYMLDWMYNVETLVNQMDNGHDFFLLYHLDRPIGFIGLELQEEIKKVKIHKLYLLPTHQGKGLGKQMFLHALAYASQKSALAVYLNVNRFNAAVQFYLGMGMQITRSEDIDIGGGFFMNDYVMEKGLTIL